MTNDASDNKAIVREYLKSFNDRDRDAMGELLAADAIEHGVHGEIHGREAIVDFLAGQFRRPEPFLGRRQRENGIRHRYIEVGPLATGFPLQKAGYDGKCSHEASPHVADRIPRVGRHLTVSGLGLV